MTQNAKRISVETTVNAPVEKVWSKWTNPEDIVNWNTASPDWHTPRATNDLRVGGRFDARMEAKDGSFGFDFWGIYEAVNVNEYIEYTVGDGRKVSISFSPMGNQTKVLETFDAEAENPAEVQKAGWQSILDNFKQYVESSK